MLDSVVRKLEKTFWKIRSARQQRRWTKLQHNRMKIGKNVHFPTST
jgi:hypothetical protein